MHPIKSTFQSSVAADLIFYARYERGNVGHCVANCMQNKTLGELWKKKAGICDFFIQFLHKLVVGEKLIKSLFKWSEQKVHPR